MSRIQVSSRSRSWGMPWFLPLFGALFSAAGCFVIVTFGQLTILTCDRLNPATASTQGMCQLTATRLLDSNTTEIPLNELRQATIVTQTNSKGNQTHQVILQAERGDVPFTFYASSGLADHQAIANQINTFLQNSQQTTLFVQQDDRWFGYLLGGIFALLGMVPIGIAVFSMLRRR